MTKKLIKHLDKTKLKTYKVPVDRNDYGYVIIKAKSKKGAYNLVNNGEWTNDMYEVKGGDTIVYNEDIIKL